MSKVIEFRGDAWRLAKCWAVGLIGAGALFGWILLGPIGLRVSAVAVIAAIPFLALVALVIARWDVVRFDDEVGEIFAPGRPRIKYSDLRVVRISKVFGLLSVRLGKSRWRAANYLIAGAGADRTAIEKALKQRCPEVKIRRALWIERYAPIIMAVLLCSGYGAFEVWAQPRRVSCELKPTPPETERAEADAIRVPGWEITPPLGFELLDQDFTHASLRRSGGGDIIIFPFSLSEIVRRNPRSSFLAGSWPGFVLGIDSATGWIEYTLCANQGVIPGIISSYLLRPEFVGAQPRISIFSARAIEAVVIHGSPSDRNGDQIWVAGQERETELQIQVTGPEQLVDDWTASILSNIR